jgi:hypothetical protein
MFTAEELHYLRELYANIFEENADNSKEFITFANGIPHPLRIKVENWIEGAKKMRERDNLMRSKIHAAIEFDAFITNYIENTYE